ncbi:MAG: hypothetical protein LZF62_240043 [Nitrospira sp.]|nr:MAG: hypothetical protein LZF62_240043 [Nitrospira sp.]
MIRLRVTGPTITFEIVSAGIIGVEHMSRIAFEMTQCLAVMCILRDPTAHRFFSASFPQ